MNHRSKVLSDRLGITSDDRNDVPAWRHQIGCGALSNRERRFHGEGVIVYVAHECRPLLGCTSLRVADQHRGHVAVCVAVVRGDEAMV
jgi:hypothetical protein